MAEANPLPSGLPQIRPTRWFTHTRTKPEIVALLEARSRTLEFARDPRAIWCSALLMLWQSDRAPSDDTEHDGQAWVARVELEAARHYLMAMDSWDRGDLSLTPMPWRLIFARDRHDPPGVDDALSAAIAVHCTYDLPLAIARLGLPGDTAASRRSFDERTASLAADLHVVRRAIRKRYGGRAAILHLLEEPWGGGFAASSVRAWRARAWDDAQALIAAAAEDDALSETFTRIEARAIDVSARPSGARTPARVRAASQTSHR